MEIRFTEVTVNGFDQKSDKFVIIIIVIIGTLSWNVAFILHAMGNKLKQHYGYGS